MLLLPPRFTRTYTLFPYTALFLAELHRRARDLVAGDLLRPRLQRRRRIGNDLHGNRTRRGIGHGGRLRRLGWKKRRRRRAAAPRGRAAGPPATQGRTAPPWRRAAPASLRPGSTGRPSLAPRSPAARRNRRGLCGRTAPGPSPR